MLRLDGIGGLIPAFLKAMIARKLRFFRRLHSLT